MGRPARNTAGRLRPCITLITTRNPPTIRSGRSSADSISVKPPRLTSTSPPTVTHRSRRRRARRAVWRSPRDGVLTRPSSAADRQGAKPQDQPPPVASRTRCQKPSPCHWIRRSPGRPSGAPCHFTLAKGINGASVHQRPATHQQYQCQDHRTDAGHRRKQPHLRLRNRHPTRPPEPTPQAKRRWRECRAPGGFQDSTLGPLPSQRKCWRARHPERHHPSSRLDAGQPHYAIGP